MSLSDVATRCLEAFRVPVQLTHEEQLDAVPPHHLGVLHVSSTDGCLLLADPTCVLACGRDRRFDQASDFRTAMDKVRVRTRWALVRGRADAVTSPRHTIGLAIRADEERCSMYVRRLGDVRRYCVRVSAAEGRAYRKPLGRLAASDALILGSSADLLPEGEASLHFPDVFDLEHAVSGQHRYQFIPGVGLLINTPSDRQLVVQGLFTDGGLTEVYVEV